MLLDARALTARWPKRAVALPCSVQMNLGSVQAVVTASSYVLVLMSVIRVTCFFKHVRALYPSITTQHAYSLVVSAYNHFTYELQLQRRE
jgi:hypothetical protein